MIGAEKQAGDLRMEKFLPTENQVDRRHCGLARAPRLTARAFDWMLLALEI
jgi:hypothetical protein